MNLARIAEQPIRRRGLFGLGGGAIAAGALAGCGTEVEEPSAGRDAKLLGEAVVGEENAASALQRAETEVEASERATVRAMREAASQQAAELQDAVEELGEAPSGEFGADTDADPLAAAVDSTNQAVAAYRLGAGQFSTEELRRQALEWMFADGARLALLHELLGDDPAPHPFVTGAEEKPLSFPDEDDEETGDEDEATTTTTTDSEATTTTTAAEGE